MMRQSSHSKGPCKLKRSSSGSRDGQQAVPFRHRCQGDDLLWSLKF